ncbi:DUF5690 family protein [Asticcacaulis taihuensis]|uniref:Sugar phosphate permease n=1 Tax=Asticcacaulis taihuensis TaxID=260084 RepID=A0A1G4TLE3_9CAUL|nr:DUF5690 family protein [Asticcacaulis taihuensis]SCW82124.1 hypothetical protein SAMN02927928_3680 [Asticcacaulis taihuensis]
MSTIDAPLPAGARQTGFTAWLAKAPPLVFALYGGLMAFGAYFAMYAYRKPFAVASFTDVAGFVVDYKIALVISQVFGYALSKVIGVKVISELPGRYRAIAILLLIGFAEAMLVAFASVPAPYNIACLFLNGLSLGLIWGLVFGFLEGRRVSEILGSILCASFIVSSGVVKSVGKWVMLEHYANEFWMPAVTGLLFAPLLLICVLGLSQLPPPSPEDEAARVARVPMNKAARKTVFGAFAPGLVALVVIYIGLTALRDFRDNFAAEIWSDLGFGDNAGIFTASELPIGIVVLAAMCLLALFRNNRLAFMANLAMVGIGLVLAAASTFAFQAHILGPITWMILLGGGLYLAYTPFNALLFDRFIAASGLVGTAGFLIYVADASGYLGSTALLLFKNFSGVSLPWAQFLVASTYGTAAVGLILLIWSAIYFARRLKV